MKTIVEELAQRREIMVVERDIVQAKLNDLETSIEHYDALIALEEEKFGDVGVTDSPTTPLKDFVLETVRQHSPTPATLRELAVEAGYGSANGGPAIGRQLHGTSMARMNNGLIHKDGDRWRPA